MLRETAGEQHTAAHPIGDLFSGLGDHGAQPRLPAWLDLPEPKGFRPKRK